MFGRVYLTHGLVGSVPLSLWALTYAFYIPIFSLIQSRRLAFTTGLRPLTIGPHEFSLGQMESRSFDCLVHLACSLLHHVDIVAGSSSTQITDILQITSTLALYGRLYPANSAFQSLLTSTSRHASWRWCARFSSSLLCEQFGVIYYDAIVTTTETVVLLRHRWLAYSHPYFHGNPRVELLRNWTSLSSKSSLGASL